MPWLFAVLQGCLLGELVGGDGLQGDFEADLELEGECGERLRAGADLVGFDNGSATITFFTPQRDRDENCEVGFAWSWAADEGALGPFSANACLFGLDVFLDGGTLRPDGDAWLAEGTGGIEEIGVTELCSGTYALTFVPR